MKFDLLSFANKREGKLISQQNLIQLEHFLMGRRL